jgi:hypothetical protein
LDEILPQLGITKVDFIKIDVEGADELVCKGATQTLRNQRPTVLFEHNPAAAGKLNIDGKGTGTVLRYLGYDFFRIEQGKGIQVQPESMPETNILAIHPERVALFNL